MTELIGRFLSFEEHMGRGLIMFGYYLLLFLLVVTTLYDLVVTFGGFFGPHFIGNLGKFLILIPVRFVVMLVGLRVATEFVLAVMGIDESLKREPLDYDVLSSGINPVRQPQSQMASAAPAEAASDDADEEESAPSSKTAKKRTKKTTKKTRKKAATKKTAAPAAETGAETNAETANADAEDTPQPSAAPGSSDNA